MQKNHLEMCFDVITYGLFNLLQLDFYEFWKETPVPYVWSISITSIGDRMTDHVIIFPLGQYFAL